VERFAVGCGNFGGIGSAPELFGQGLGQDQAFAVMDAAWELGIRAFDTADAYGGGRSEQMIGRWIASRGVRPAITTKTFNPMDAGADHGLAPERIHRQLGASLERLGVDRVDLYLAHSYDPDVPLADMLAAFAAARERGSIAAYGVSNFDAGQLTAAVATAAGEISAVQNNYSLLERADRDTVLPLCATRGIGFQAFSPLAGGWLTGKYRRGEPFPAGSRMTQRPEPYAGYRNDGTFGVLERLKLIAVGRRGTTPSRTLAGLALAWLLADDRVRTVVLGPGRTEHLAPVREALAHPLSQAELAAIEEAVA
jgi:aryl-alcohol dehydrogenase-like predicted oxidoreductase